MDGSARPFFVINFVCIGGCILPVRENNKDMKRNKSTKKNFDTFNKRQGRSSRGKDAAKRELLRAVMETNVGFDALKLSDSFDGGRRSRTSMKMRKDEEVAIGEFSSSRSGFGFVKVEGKERDIFIPEDKTLGAIDGDEVEIVFHSYITRMGEEKTEGRVKRIVREGRKTVIGTVEARKRYIRSRGLPMNEYILVPDDSKLSESYKIADIGTAAVGDKAEAQIVRGQGYNECRIKRVFGKAESFGANYEAILAECEIPVDFSREELAEAEFFASFPLSDEGRVRRSEIIFTIDGEDAKDLDDAVSIKKVRCGWQLGVHIADVSSYVKERTHLDRAVMARGTSVYFTDKVVPMLPTSLSNGACSLNAGEDKYTLSAIISLDESGEIKGVKIEPSIINSRVRGVYSEVNKILSGEADEPTRVKYKEVKNSLVRMEELYNILLKKAKARGYMELESEECKILLDASGTPYDIVLRDRGVSERMIEQFMLTANEAVARFLSENEIPCVYRVHDDPPPEKLMGFLTYAHNLGFNARIINQDKCEAKDFSDLLELAEEKGMGRQVSYTMLRAMSKAKYSDVRSKHFGLSLTHYCHFTSPIRRLSDLATHRIIHKVLIEGKRAELYSKYAHRAAAAATEAELRAIGAERRIENLYKVIFMADRVGEEFDAVINSITSFGFFASLDNTCEGLVPISELRGDYIFDEKNLTLRSRRHTYRIADTVRVRLEEADIIRGKLRFSVVEE